MKPDRAFILAAGLGTRLRPLTDSRPKPLALVNGKTLLDRTLDQLAEAGIKQAVINTHYLSGQIENHVQSRRNPKTVISHEPVLLDTGGGIKNALHHFKDEPFFVFSGDGLWQDAPRHSALDAMAEKWDPQAMDILILLQRVDDMRLTQGIGDYDINPDGRAVRLKDKTGSFMFTSMRLHHPRIFESAPEGAFSYLTLLDEAERQGRLHALIHDGAWHHISTMRDLGAVDQFYKKAGL